MKEKRIHKLEEAKSIIKCSIGSLGISAGCDRYEDQFWTRDFALAGEDSLLLLKYDDIVKKHLLEIAKRQRSSGSIPSRFAKSRIRFIKKLFKEEVLGDWKYLIHKLFLSQTYIIKRNPFNFHRWTIWYADSEILFVLAVKKYIINVNNETDDFLSSNITSAFDYIEKKLIKDDLVIGSDWRDTIYFLSDKPILSVNILLWRAYMLNGKNSKAKKIKEAIEKNFWNGGYYSDTPGDLIFDTFAHSLILLWDFAPASRHEKVIKKLGEMETPFGYMANDMSFPKKLLKYQEIERTNQFSTVWPFIHGYAILALIHLKKYDLAKKQMDVWDKINGFYEWYNPKDGKGYGGKGQMWSAALYLCASSALDKLDGLE